MSTALAGSAFLYLAHWNLADPRVETLSALLFYILLLHTDRRTWFWSGFFIGLLWFNWIGVSFLHYGHPWAIPLVDLAVALIYGVYFWLFAWLTELLTQNINRLFSILNSQFSIRSSYLKALTLLGMSYVHPFGFDWFKPELPLIHTPFGVDKLHFASLLLSLLLFGSFLGRVKSTRKESGSSTPKGVGKSHPATYLLPLLALLALYTAYSPARVQVSPDDPEGKIALAATHVPVEEKWRPERLRSQIATVFEKIDDAIRRKKRAVLLPESVLPIFLNREAAILDALKKRSEEIDIVLGALYFRNGENRNSAYFFHDGSYTVADKIVLVPFGEANPLPDWASRWVNAIFFDGAPDYRPAETPTDFTIAGRKYRAAVCYEGSSEKLYEDRPKRIVLLSNNGWFVPSVEPTLQRLLLEYYSRKYGTTIYHAVNMGPSYVVLRIEN